MQAFNNFLLKHQNRVIGLDILRCVAILIVIYGHGRYLLPEAYHKIYTRLNLLNLDGVSVFFTLSGFLIGGILLRKIHSANFGNKELLVFWLRRWLRTIPTYILVLSGILIYQFATSKRAEEHVINYFFFSQNLWYSHPEFFPEAWSLSVEEWFYLLFPLMCYLLIRFLKKEETTVFIVTLVFIVVPLVLRIVKYESGIESNSFDLELRKIVLLRLDSLMYGVLGAFIFSKYPDLWRRLKYWFLSAGIALLILLKFNPGYWNKFYPPVLFNIESLTVFCFLPFLSLYKTTGIRFIDGVVIFISIISYSMYLLNIQVRDILIPWILKQEIFSSNGNHWLDYFLFWFFTIGFSWLLYRYFEKPITDLRERIGKEQSL